MGQVTVLGLIGAALAGTAVGAAWPLPALGIGWVLLVVASALVGPLWPAVSPLRLLPARSPRMPRTAAVIERLGAWPSAGMLAGVAVLVHVGSPRPAGATAPLLMVLAALGGAATWWGLGLARTEGVDPAAALVAIPAALAPIGRSGGAWTLRSPVPALAHQVPRVGLRPLLAVVAGAGLAHVADPRVVAWVGDGPIVRAAVLATAIALAAAGMRLAAIRRFLDPSLMAATAGWTLAHHATLALSAAGAPRALTAGVAIAALLAGHLVAVAAGHRAALARFDLRASRAVQFPLRTVLAASAATGAGLLAA